MRKIALIKFYLVEKNKCLTLVAVVFVLNQITQQCFVHGKRAALGHLPDGI